MADVPRLSAGQLGAIRERFRQLGLGDDERPWRLSASAALLGLSHLDTTKDLDTVQAGKLVRLLASFDDEADLQIAVAAIRRERVRERFFTRLAVALAQQGPWRSHPLPGQLEEVPDAPGHHAARPG